MTEPSKPKTLVVATSKTGNTMIVAHAVADAERLLRRTY